MLDRNIEVLCTMAAAANLDMAVGCSPSIGEVNSLRELSMRAPAGIAIIELLAIARTIS